MRFGARLKFQAKIDQSRIILAKVIKELIKENKKIIN